MLSTSAERSFKKEKQILVEFDLLTKDIRYQLNEQLKCLEQRMDTQLCILGEIQDYFKKRADVEMEYSRNLENLVKSMSQKIKAQKSRRDCLWSLHSTTNLLDAVLTDTKQQAKSHAYFSELCGKHMYEKFFEINEDTRRMFQKCKNVSLTCHSELFKTLNEVQNSMKSYHHYQSESKQAELKLTSILQQISKHKTMKPKIERRIEKRKFKYADTKMKAFKARNDYLLCIESSNSALSKYFGDDIADLFDCMNFGFHTSVAKCILMYLSGQTQIIKSRQLSNDTLNRSIGDLDAISDKQRYLEYYSSVFLAPKRIKFEPHKGDEVSIINAQALIRNEMQQRYEAIGERLKSLSTEHEEVFKTIEATEKALMHLINVKSYDVSDLFKGLHFDASCCESKRLELENYYIEKFRQYTLISNLIARLKVKGSMLQRALGSSQTNESTEIVKKTKPKRIGKAPIIGRPRLFGGKLLDYIEATEQVIPQIIFTCVRAINRLGLHNQGIFRVSGSQVDINNFKEQFERGEDPLLNVTSRDMNSVAGVLKLYFRELKDPLFPRDNFDDFMTIMSEAKSEKDCVNNLQVAVTKLPKPIYIVMRYFFAFLNHLTEYSDENMMDSANIASCLAPTLIPVPAEYEQVRYLGNTIELVRVIVTHHDEIFSQKMEGPVYEKFLCESTEFEDIENSEHDDDDDEVLSDKSDTYEAVALFDYNGKSEKELSFKRGDYIHLHSKLSKDWWLGSLNNDCGFVPEKYLTRKRNSNPIPQHSSDDKCRSESFSVFCENITNIEQCKKNANSVDSFPNGKISSEMNSNVGSSVKQPIQRPNSFNNKSLIAPDLVMDLPVQDEEEIKNNSCALSDASMNHSYSSPFVPYKNFTNKMRRDKPAGRPISPHSNSSECVRATDDHNSLINSYQTEMEIFYSTPKPHLKDSVSESSLKKIPPPVMKKPEKSEEILKKLGKQSSAAQRKVVSTKTTDV